MKISKNEVVKYIECYHSPKELLSQLETLNKEYDVINSGVSFSNDGFVLYWMFIKFLNEN